MRVKIWAIVLWAALALSGCTQPLFAAGVHSPPVQGGFSTNAPYPGPYPVLPRGSSVVAQGDFAIGPLTVKNLQSKADGNRIQLGYVLPGVPAGMRVPTIVIASPYLPDLATTTDVNATRINYDGAAYNFVPRSDDDGKTWSAPRLAQGIENRPVLSAAQLAASSDGTLALAIISVEKDGESWIAISRDSGVTWKESPAVAFGSAVGGGEGTINGVAATAEGFVALTGAKQKIDMIRWRGGDWSGPITLASGPQLAGALPGIAVTTSGDVIVDYSWAESDRTQLRAIAIVDDRVTEPLVLLDDQGRATQQGSQGIIGVDYLYPAPTPSGVVIPWIEGDFGHTTLGAVRVEIGKP